MQKGLSRKWSYSGLETMFRIYLMYYVDFYSLFNNSEKGWEEILKEATESPPVPSLFAPRIYFIRWLGIAKKEGSTAELHNWLFPFLKFLDGSSKDLTQHAILDYLKKLDSENGHGKCPLLEELNYEHRNGARYWF